MADYLRFAYEFVNLTETTYLPVVNVSTAEAVTLTETTDVQVRLSPGVGLILRPHHDASFQDWDLSNTAVPAWTLIDDVDPDGDTSYIYTEDDGAKATFGLQNVYLPASSPHRIAGLTVEWVLKQETLAIVQPLFVLDDVEWTDTAFPQASVFSIGNYLSFRRFYPFNPFTGRLWTTPDLYRLEVGIENVTGENRLTKLQVDVAAEDVPLKVDLTDIGIHNEWPVYPSTGSPVATLSQDDGGRSYIYTSASGKLFTGTVRAIRFIDMFRVDKAQISIRAVGNGAITPFLVNEGNNFYGPSGEWSNSLTTDWRTFNVPFPCPPAFDGGRWDLEEILSTDWGVKSIGGTNSGTGDTILKLGYSPNWINELTNSGASFDSSIVGKDITVTGAGNGNDGTFTVASFVNAYTIRWINSASTGDSTGSFIWNLVDIKVGSIQLEVFGSLRPEQELRLPPDGSGFHSDWTIGSPDVGEQPFQDVNSYLPDDTSWLVGDAQTFGDTQVSTFSITTSASENWYGLRWVSRVAKENSSNVPAIVAPVVRHNNKTWIGRGFKINGGDFREVSETLWIDPDGGKPWTDVSNLEVGIAVLQGRALCSWLHLDCGIVPPRIAPVTNAVCEFTSTGQANVARAITDNLIWVVDKYVVGRGGFDWTNPQVVLPIEPGDDSLSAPIWEGEVDKSWRDETTAYYWCAIPPDKFQEPLGEIMLMARVVSSDGGDVVGDYFPLAVAHFPAGFHTSRSIRVVRLTLNYAAPTPPPPAGPILMGLGGWPGMVI